MIDLGVNIDHVATLRQARGGFHPDPLDAAKICEKAGAHSVVMHLREDRRHIQDKDLFRVQEKINIKLNLEMSIAPSVVKMALRLKPDQVTLVPEKRQERTTEGGLDLFNKKATLKKTLDQFHHKNIPVSLFIDPDIRQLKEAKRLGVHAVEFHTGDYANQKTSEGAKKELKRLRDAVFMAQAMKIHAYAGHGLDYENIAGIKAIHGIEEVNIGYAIVTRALWVGMDKAVREMLNLLR